VISLAEIRDCLYSCSKGASTGLIRRSHLEVLGLELA
jgi:hypothetical protein